MSHLLEFASRAFFFQVLPGRRGSPAGDATHINTSIAIYPCHKRHLRTGQKGRKAWKAMEIIRNTGTDAGTPSLEHLREALWLHPYAVDDLKAVRSDQNRVVHRQII